MTCWVKWRKNLFQFHKGTIKTTYYSTKQYASWLFQFHKGTIKTLSLRMQRLSFCNFNSIKVRLKPVVQARSGVIITFQFHKGTIKT